MILYFSDYFGKKSGVGKSASDVVVALLASGHPVSVVSCYSRRHFSGLAQFEGTSLPTPEWITAPRAIAFPAPKISLQYPRALLRWGYWRWLSMLRFSAVNRISTLAPRLLIVNSFGGHDLCMQCGCHSTTPSVMVVRGSPAMLKSKYSAQSLQDTLDVMAQYPYLVFVSSRVKDQWLEFDALKGKQTFYIPNCADEEEVASIARQEKTAVRRRLGLPSDRFVAVCVANIQHRKGQDLLVDHFNEIAEVAPDLDLYLIGAPLGSWGHQLLKAIRVKGLTNRIKYLGIRKNALSYIYASDMLVLPTRAEALPRVILESMVLKTPILATRVAGIPELIEDGVDGRLIDSESPYQLVEAFGALVNDKDGSERIAEHAYEKYWSNFSRAQQIQRFGNAINDMLNF